MEELISVIVPIYNAEKYLNICIQSIVDQTYRNLQIILVDDGSTDLSFEICDNWGEKDSRIKVLHQKNQGAAMAKNQGLDLARGELITFVDSDDCIKKNMYDKLYKLMKNKQCDIVECNYQSFENVILNEQDIIKEKIEICNNIKAMEYLIDNSKIKPVVWNKLYKRSVINNTRFPKGRYIDDEFWIYKVIDKANKVGIINDKLYFYRQHQDSIMGRKYNIRRLDAVDAMKERMLYIKKNKPELEDKAALSYIATTMYHYQCLDLYRNELDKDKTFRKKIYKGLKELKKNEFRKALKRVNIKYKIWYLIFFVCPDMTCRLRNYLKIGM